MPPRIALRAARAPSASCVHSRAFTSTPAAAALGPQSPAYIDVPKPAQPSYDRPPQLKGHLPIPRDIFHTRNPHPKHSDPFLRKSTRDAKDPKLPGPFARDADVRLHKQRMAEARKTALEHGVAELHARRTAADAAHLARIQHSGQERTRLATAPRRTVDVLTDTSVSKGVRDFLADALPAPAKNIAARRRAYDRRQAAQQTVRESRLHDLYTNARSFIVTEAQLDAAIDANFGTDEAPIGWDLAGAMGPRADGKEGLSPWHGPIPEGTSELMHKLRGGEGVGLAKERVRKLAEHLTGGKM